MFRAYSVSHLARFSGQAVLDPNKMRILLVNSLLGYSTRDLSQPPVFALYRVRVLFFI